MLETKQPQAEAQATNPAASAAPASAAVAATPQSTDQNAAPAASTPAAAAPATDLLSGVEAPLEFTAPEGHELDPEVIKVYSGAVKDVALKGDSAQKLLNAMLPALQAQRERQHAQEVAAWAEATKADPTIGGANLPATLTKAREAMKRLATPEFTALVSRLGLGSNKEFLRVLSKVADLVSPDSLFLAGSDAAAANAEPSEQKTLDARYPKSVKR